MKAYKTVITFFICILFSCASTQKIVVQTSDEIQVSAKKFVETCPVPVERHFIKQFNAKVFRHNNCMNIDDLLTVVWSGKLTSAAIDGASLLAIGYVAGLVETYPDMKHTVRPLGVDTFHYQNIDYHISFFELKHRSGGDT